MITLFIFIQDDIIYLKTYTVQFLTDHLEFESMLRGWMSEAGPDLEMKFVQKFVDQTMTSVAASDPWWTALTKAFDKHSLKVKPQIFPAGTDSRYLREVS